MKYELVPVGKTRKTIGFDGSIRIEIKDKYFEDVLKAEAFFIEYGYEVIPFFPVSLTEDRFLVVKFDDIRSKEEATKITGKEIYIRKSEIHDEEANRSEDLPEFESLIGLDLYDEELGLIGKIISIESFPQQEMLIVEYNSKQVMVPLHADLVVEYIPAERIMLALPEGILTL